MFIFNAIMALFFVTIGVSYSKEFRKYEKYIFVALLFHDITLTSGLTIAFFQASKKIQKIEIASCTISMIMAAWFRLVLSKQRKYLHRTIDVLREDPVMKYKTHQKVQGKFFIIIFFIVLSSVMIFLSPILRFVTGTTVNYNDSSIYIVPFLFKYRDFHSLIEYVSVVSIQGSMIGFNANAVWSYVIFTCYMLCSLEAHIENINVKLIDMLTNNENKLENQYELDKKPGKQLNSYDQLKTGIENLDLIDMLILNDNKGRNQNQTGKKNGKKKMSNLLNQQVIRCQIMKEGFDQLIRYQQFYYEHLKNFMNYLYWTYVGTLVWILLTLVLTMFAISQIPKDVFFLMKKIAISVNFVLVFYLQCYIGEAVSRLADSLLTSFYNSPWYILPTCVRKNMVVVMIQSQKQFDFTIFGMFTINLRLFTRVVKIIYTITNLLIASQKKINESF